MQIRFDIRKARNKKTYVAGNATGKPTHDSLVQVTITIGKVRYGPYGTGIFTLRAYWDGRKSHRVKDESKALINELAAYQQLLEAVHADMIKVMDDVSGEAIYQAVQGSKEKKTLLLVYNEFLLARKDMIEPNRKLRSEDQISQATYDSYEKRWNMILVYLQETQQTSLPLSWLTYNFVTKFKEFMMGYHVGGKRAYKPATINKAISLLKMLATYARSRDYVTVNAIAGFSCRGGSPAKPKPLSEAMIHHLETCQLPAGLRHVCDSWLIAAELCFHYSDYMQLPKIEFITHNGKTYVQHERSKQNGNALVQTVNVTARATRLLEKWGGPDKLYYKSSGAFSHALKKIAYRAELTWPNGEYVDLQFGMGRDTGLTDRVRKGANGMQLSKMAGWANPSVAKHYIGDSLGIVAGFVEAFAKNA